MISKAIWPVLALTSALALAACDSGSVPPPGQEPLRPSTPQVAEDEIVLRAEGLIAGSEAFYFSAGRNEIEAALEPIVGPPSQRSENPECGAGPMAFTEYETGLILNFQEGNLVGWNTTDARPSITIVGDVQIGTARDQAEQSKGYSAIPTSTVGDEFALGDAIGGVFDGDSVGMRYAGAQCFFR